MSVNTMSFEDASAILNNIRQQVTGESSLAPVNTADFVAVGTTLLQSGYDPVLNAITQMVTKTIFSIRPYSRKFGGIKVDSEMWGSIVRKLAIADKAWEPNAEFDLVDGQSIDHYKVSKPDVLELKFYGAEDFRSTTRFLRTSLTMLSQVRLNLVVLCQWSFRMLAI